MLNKIKKYTSIIYYNILNLLFGKASFFYLIANIEHTSYARLPGHYHWTDDYFLWCKYISKKSMNDNTTLEEIKNEYFNNWKEEFKKAKKKLDDRDMSGLID
jgi:hypothetical protein